MNKKKQQHKTISSSVVEVYEDNFYDEIERIASLAPTYNYIAMVSIGKPSD
jgi:hypothetical protein